MQWGDRCRQSRLGPTNRKAPTPDRCTPRQPLGLEDVPSVELKEPSQAARSCGLSRILLCTIELFAIMDTEVNSLLTVRLTL